LKRNFNAWIATCLCGFKVRWACLDYSSILYIYFLTLQPFVPNFQIKAPFINELLHCYVRSICSTALVHPFSSVSTSSSQLTRRCPNSQEPYGALGTVCRRNINCNFPDICCLASSV